MTIELDSTLAQAEVLFLSFAQLVEDMDRRRAESSIPGAGDGGLLRKRKPVPGRAQPTVEAVGIPELSGELREVLKSGCGSC